ncbi:hypothetical protein VL04_03520 [Chromobacterium violaceum]|uniref:hypothetical protein n=1 Tax=Chromobacterium violaceum TaxID=536 RepID=UPI00065290A4|nr:hypothetical protein [Chromobacterium violaceum]KMN48965.1 hypothetical protein VK93_11975 [Chromobacterium violaceum]KMN85189.1 hypothetical protein VL02_16360 [Chromobacterium violaceum]KMN91759.1 hypothetical protein VL04_03520 [Chromobacterium violaceum]KMO02881.1 hypothetical protein VL16_15785 [Chromobacterium violaceum]
MNVAKKVEGQLKRLILELDKATGSAEFEDEDVFRFVRDAAALWERMLKRCTLSNAPSDPTLYNLTNALEFNGVDFDRREALHKLRKSANKGKHDSDATLTAASARSLIEATILTLGQLESAGIAELAAIADFNQRRRYAIDVYDHYVHGDTEYLIYLYAGAPGGDSILAPEPIELFSVNFKAEEVIKQQLVNTGDAIFDNPCTGLPSSVSDDYIGRWVWEGTHRDLVAAFAPYQWHADLIPGLSRADHYSSVISAAALAMVDVARPAKWQDLLWKMSADFGIWRRGTIAVEVAQAVVALSGGLIGQDYYGPRWLDRSDVLSLTSPRQRFEGNGFVLGIDENRVVLVGLDLSQRGISFSVLDEDDLCRPQDPFETC